MKNRLGTDFYHVARLAERSPWLFSALIALVSFPAQLWVVYLPLDWALMSIPAVTLIVRIGLVIIGLDESPPPGDIRAGAVAVELLLALGVMFVAGSIVRLYDHFIIQ